MFQVDDLSANRFSLKLRQQVGKGTPHESPCCKQQLLSQELSPSPCCSEPAESTEMLPRRRLPGNTDFRV